MRDTLYVSLRDPGADGRRRFALETENAPGAPTVELADPEQVWNQCVGRRVILVAPAEDVRLATINVPARQAQKVLQAAPYALEDQLAEDVDTLHFSIGARLPDGSHPVAVVARERMETWLEPLRSRGLAAEAVVPEILCLPNPAPGEWVALAEAGESAGARLLARTGPCAGFTCSLEQLPGFLDLADPQGTARLTVYPTAGVDADFTRAGRPVELRPGHAHALELLVRHHAGAINLLQGAYAPRRGWAAGLQPWKTAGGLAAAWALLALAHQGLQVWDASRELAAQDARNLARFQGLYPTETRIVDLPAQTSQKLAALRGGGASAPWFESLDLLSAALAANPGLSLRTLQFREGALYLQLTGTDLQAFESMRLWFEGRPDAQISDVQANAGSDGVQVRFKLVRRA